MEWTGKRTISMAYSYLKTEQIVPSQGMSYTYYEIEGQDQILRMLTTIPATGMIKPYPKPPVKKLFAPERCQSATEEEFMELWNQADDPEAI